VQVVGGNATHPAVLSAAGIEKSTTLLLAIPEGFEAGVVAERARVLNPGLVIIARAHSDAEVEHLERLGANHVVMAERETAARMFSLVAQIATEEKADGA
jgi:monovalent cation:H+ antiporter-2, CPA2 family